MQVSVVQFRPWAPKIKKSSFYIGDLGADFVPPLSAWAQPPTGIQIRSSSGRRCVPKMGLALTIFGISSPFGALGSDAIATTAMFRSLAISAFGGQGGV
jgi:hypothetical protein